MDSAREQFEKQAKDHDLSPPVPLTREPPKAREFPIDALGPLLGPAVEAIQIDVQAPMAVCAQAVQGAISLATQAQADVELPLPTPVVVPISEFFLSIAASGVRKTSADRRATEAVHNRKDDLNFKYKDAMRSFDIMKRSYDRARKQILDDKKLNKAEVEQRLENLGYEPEKPLEPTLLCSDPTMEGIYVDLALGQPSIGLFTTEGGQFFGGYSMNKDNKIRTAATLSKLWGGDELDRSRGSNPRELPRSLQGRRFTMNISAQPEVAKTFFFDRHLKAQGLLSRFLICFPPDNIGSRKLYDLNTEEKDTLGRYKKRLYDLMSMPLPLVEKTTNVLQPPVLKLTPQAIKLFDETYREIERGTVSGGVTTDFRNKFMEHACRQAAQLAVFEAENEPATVVKSGHLEDGITLTRYYLAELERLYSVFDVPENIRLAQELVNWLMSKWTEDLVSMPDIGRLGPYALRTTEAMQPIIGILVEHGYLIHQHQGGIVAGKSRRETWLVNRKKPE
jgi:hypothetical protein